MSWIPGPGNLGWPVRAQFWDSYKGHLTPLGAKLLTDTGREILADPGVPLQIRWFLMIFEIAKRIKRYQETCENGRLFWFRALIPRYSKQHWFDQPHGTFDERPWKGFFRKQLRTNACCLLAPTFWTFFFLDNVAGAGCQELCSESAISVPQMNVGSKWGSQMFDTWATSLLPIRSCDSGAKSYLLSTDGWVYAVVTKIRRTCILFSDNAVSCIVTVLNATNHQWPAHNTQATAAAFLTVCRKLMVGLWQCRLVVHSAGKDCWLQAWQLDSKNPDQIWSWRRRYLSTTRMRYTSNVQRTLQSAWSLLLGH